MAAGAALGTLGAAVSPPARADTILVRSAEIRAEDDDYVLNADFELTLNATLEEALHRGVPLYFILEFESAPAGTGSTTSLRDERPVPIAWNALTRQYRVSSGPSARRLQPRRGRAVPLARDFAPGRPRDQLQKGSLRRRAAAAARRQPAAGRSRSTRSRRRSGRCSRTGTGGFTAEYEHFPRDPLPALAAADRHVARRDLAVPARDGDGEHRALRPQLRPAAGHQRRDGRC
jgi:hypothetical protein